MKTQFALAFLLGFVFCSNTTAQFQLDTKAIDQVFSEWDKPDSPGCAVAILKDGEIVYSKGFGMANLDHQVPNQPNTVFRIASTSKQITAALMALLDQEGVLSLDDDIRKWIPELPDYGKTITVRDLIHHASGLRDYTTIMAVTDSLDDHWTDEETLEIIVRQKGLNFDPGTEFSYCNSGYFLLSVICERATGTTIRQCADKYIFRPLTMEQTHFHDNYKEVVPHRAIGYERNDDGDWEISTTRLELCGDGGLFTTVEDYAHWDENFYTGQVGGPEFLKTIQTPGGVNSGQPEGYAFGLDISQYRGLPIVSHAGAWVGYRAEMIRFPEQHFTVICFSNAANCTPGRLCYAVADLCLAGVFPNGNVDREHNTTQDESNNRSWSAPTYIDLPQETYASLDGRWINEERNISIKLKAVDNGVIVKMWDERVLLRPTSETTFREGPDTDFKVEMEAISGDEPQLMLRFDAGQMTFVRQEETHLTLEQLNRYVGRYYSNEIELFCRIDLDDHQLVLRIGGDSYELRAITKHEFVGPFDTKLMFNQQDDDRTSFFLNQFNLRGLEFHSVVSPSSD